MVLHEYTYIFALGTMFALLEAYNNGASKSLEADLLRPAPGESQDNI